MQERESIKECLSFTYIISLDPNADWVAACHFDNLDADDVQSSSELELLEYLALSVEPNDHARNLRLCFGDEEADENESEIASKESKGNRTAQEYSVNVVSLSCWTIT